MKNIKMLCLLMFGMIPMIAIAQMPYPYTLKKDAQLMKKKKVKSVQITSTLEDGEPFIIETRSFDRNGLMTDSKVYDEWQDTYVFWTFEYNDYGLMTKGIGADEQGEYIYSAEEYTYEGDAVKSEQVSTMDGSYTIYYSHDDRGRIDSSFVSDAEARTNAWFYGGDELVDSIVGYSVVSYEEPAVWERTEVEVFRYGKKDVLTYQAFCGNYTGCYTHEYTYKRKSKIEEKVFGNDGELYTITYRYHKKLPIGEHRKAAEGMSDFIDNEIITYSYTFY